MTKQKIILPIAGILLVIVGISIGYIISAQKLANKAPSDPSEREEETLKTNENSKDENSTGMSGNVEYLSEPELWSTVETLRPYSKQLNTIAASKGYTGQSDEQNLSRYTAMITIAKVGTLQKAPYEGQALVNVWESCDGPCPPLLSRWAVNESTDTWTLLTQISEENSYSTFTDIFKDADATFEISEFAAPELLNWNENAQLILADDVEMAPENAQTTSVVNTSPFSSFQMPLDGGCVYGIFPDGTAARYMIAPKFMDKSTDTLTGLSQTLTFESKEGSSVTTGFSIMPASGCGFAFSCARWVNIADWSELTSAGTLNGTTVYTLSDPSKNTDSEVNRTFTQLFEDYKMRAAYDEGLPKYKSIGEFLAVTNIYLAKIDQTHGMMIVQEGLTPAAECGKPVIYLYPEEAQEVSVKVNIDRFTKTIPAHGRDGWTVWAEPNGKLTNKADGKIYPYLFWEGQKDGSVAELGQSFTLARAEIKSKLPEILKDLGLNAQEAKDFMAFWAPRMLAEKTPYLEIAFAGTKAMNVVAPLEFSEQPDTLIRLFMVYQPAQNAGNPVPDFNTPARNGFTVIEWGGLLQ